jgi:hypothetical protein
MTAQNSDYSDLRIGQGSSRWAGGRHLPRVKENSSNTEKLPPADELTTGVPELGITERERERERGTYVFYLRVNYQRFCARNLAVSK